MVLSVGVGDGDAANQGFRGVFLGRQPVQSSASHVREMPGSYIKQWLREITEISCDKAINAFSKGTFTKLNIWSIPG